MSTLAGAIVEVPDGTDFAAIAAPFRIAVEHDATPWLLVHANVTLGSLACPVFAEGLSRALGGTVIAFFVQTTASEEEIQHWVGGELVRHLRYSGDGGGWLPPKGAAQAWEPAYFFAEGEGTSAGADWPHNLDDEIEEADMARYEAARAAKDASGILDLLSGGSARPTLRLCAHFGLDFAHPAAIYTPPTNWTLRIVAAAVVLLLAGALLAGLLAPR